MNTNLPEELDVLRQVERLAETVNKEMNRRSRFALRRYPLTFTLLAVFGVVAVSEGVKGILEEIGFRNHPVYLLLIGLAILIVLGLVYKKLDSD